MIAIVKTPLQLICAVEYASYKRIPLNGVTFVFVSKYDLNSGQMFKTFEHFRIKNYKVIRFSNSNVMTLFGKQILLSKFIPLKLFAKAKKMVTDLFSERSLHKLMDSSSVIILGDPNYRLFYNLTSRFINKNIVLLDDGLSSMNIKFDYTEKHAVESFSFLRTSYPIEHANTVKENKFDVLKQANINVVSGEILFIGQPLYEANLISLDAMSALLEVFGDKFKDYTINYIPHRWEYNLDKIRFPDNFKLLQQNDLPLELFVHKMDRVPSEIMSFYSSALVTLKKILPSKINFTAIDIQRDISLEELKEAYNKIKTFNIHVVDVEKIRAESR